MLVGSETGYSGCITNGNKVIISRDTVVTHGKRKVVLTLNVLVTCLNACLLACLLALTCLLTCLLTNVSHRSR